MVMRRRVATGIGVALGAVLVAGLALYAVGTERPAPATGAPPTASPTVAVAPEATATSTEGGSPVATPSATPAATVTASDYGYVLVHSDQRIVVWRESDGSVAFQLFGLSPAVSPDGTLIAYWRTGGERGGIDLRVVEVGEPSNDRSVFEVDERTFGGAVVWSNDGEGLLIATYSRESASEHPLSGSAHNDLLMLDLSATPPATRPAAPRITDGWVYLPVLWDRADQKAAAVITGEGGYAREYVTWYGNATIPFATRQIGHAMIATSIEPSADAELLIGRSDDSLFVWHVDDPTAIFDVDRQRNPGLTSLWRPGECPPRPCQAILEVGPNIETFFWETDRRETLYTSSMASVGLRAIRPDGSAVLLTEGTGPPTSVPAARVLVLEIDSRQTREIAGFTFRTEVLLRGVIFR